MIPCREYIFLLYFVFYITVLLGGYTFFFILFINLIFLIF